MISSFTMCGRIVRMEKVQKGDTIYIRLTLAVQENKEKCHFLETTVFGKNAENLEKYCINGDTVGVSGNITTYKDKNKHTQISLTTTNLTFLAKSKKKEEQETK